MESMELKRNGDGKVTITDDSGTQTFHVPVGRSALSFLANKSNSIHDGDVFAEDGYVYRDNTRQRKWFGDLNGFRIWEPTLKDLKRVENTYQRMRTFCLAKLKEIHNDLQSMVELPEPTEENENPELVFWSSKEDMDDAVNGGRSIRTFSIDRRGIGHGLGIVHRDIPLEKQIGHIIYDEDMIAAERRHHDRYEKYTQMMWLTKVVIQRAFSDAFYKEYYKHRNDENSRHYMLQMMKVSINGRDYWVGHERSGFGIMMFPEDVVSIEVE